MRLRRIEARAPSFARFCRWQKLAHAAPQKLRFCSAVLAPPLRVAARAKRAYGSIWPVETALTRGERYARRYASRSAPAALRLLGAPQAARLRRAPLRVARPARSFLPAIAPVSLCFFLGYKSGGVAALAARAPPPLCRAPRSAAGKAGRARSALRSPPVCWPGHPRLGGPGFFALRARYGLLRPPPVAAASVRRPARFALRFAHVKQPPCRTSPVAARFARLGALRAPCWEFASLSRRSFPRREPLRSQRAALRRGLAHRLTLCRAYILKVPHPRRAPFRARPFRAPPPIGRGGAGLAEPNFSARQDKRQSVLSLGYQFSIPTETPVFTGVSCFCTLCKFRLPV